MLLEEGVRVFEWNGTMLHAKTAVADALWSRVGSTNLNLASFLGNYELDVVLEDEAFAEAMAAQFEADLERSTEIVLVAGRRVRRADRVEPGEHARRAASGSAGRVAAGAVSVGSALGAALTNRRALGPAEAGLLAKMALVALALGAVGALWPPGGGVAGGAARRMDGPLLARQGRRPAPSRVARPARRPRPEHAHVGEAADRGSPGARRPLGARRDALATSRAS